MGKPDDVILERSLKLVDVRLKQCWPKLNHCCQRIHWQNTFTSGGGRGDGLRGFKANLGQLNLKLAGLVLSLEIKTKH